MNINKYLLFAKRLALDGGQLLLKMNRNFGKIRYKSNTGNLVTAADKSAEDIIVKAIRKKYPSHQIMAEESGNCGEKTAEFQWLIDPLDGTTNYAHQLPIWAVSIALAFRKRLVAGVVYHPNMDHLYYGATGQGAFCNGKRISVSKISRLSKSLMVTGIPYSVKENSEHDNFRNFEKFSLAAQAVRRLGSAAIDLCFLASGKFDGYWERDLNSWDVAAGSLILSEAGGKITDFKGNPYNIYNPAETLASNSKIHLDMIKTLSQKD